MLKRHPVGMRGGCGKAWDGNLWALWEIMGPACQLWCAEGFSQKNESLCGAYLGLADGTIWEHGGARADLRENRGKLREKTLGCKHFIYVVCGGQSLSIHCVRSG